jgi:hypothetical protein
MIRISFVVNWCVGLELLSNVFQELFLHIEECHQLDICGAI